MSSPSQTQSKFFELLNIVVSLARLILKFEPRNPLAEDIRTFITVCEDLKEKNSKKQSLQKSLQS